MSLVHLQLGRVRLEGELTVPDGAGGLVLFAHGSGSSRLSPRNRFVAGILQSAGFATLLMDLMTRPEERLDMATAQLRFDIPFLAERVIAATRWVREQTSLSHLPLGLFGASTGAAAALIAASHMPTLVRAVVSRGGRPDLAGDALDQVQAPTLLIVGGDDHVVVGLNQAAYDRLRGPKQLAIVPGATHLFEEPGTLQEAAQLASAWFQRYLATSVPS